VRKALIAFLFLVVLMSAVSCRPPDQGNYHGFLYSTQGSYLVRFSLRDSSLEVVSHLGNNKIREISGFGDDKLLIAETAVINRKNVARISWMDLETGRVQALYSGLQARYIASAGAVVYDDGSKLYSVSWADGSGNTSHVLSHKRHRLTAMVEVSGGRLLIETAEDGLPVIQSYRAEDGTLTTLDQLGRVCSLKGAVWLDDFGHLACRKRSSGDGDAGQHYVYADLDGLILSRPSLPEGDSVLALSYISGQGALIVKESWRGQIDGQEKSTVWAHDVRSGENRELSDTLNPGSSVVYADY
jgi:hypothetical protein